MTERAGEDEAEGVWDIRDGIPYPHRAAVAPDGTGMEPLTYSNPYGYTIERVWFDGRMIYASEQGELDVDPATVKVAQEYQLVYSVELDADGHLVGEPDRVPRQFNIYDSVPGMEKYSPIWQFNYVVVPRDYVANTLRSEENCLRSGFPIRKSRVFEN